ncbi:MAG: hypothetical protein RLY97_1371, partial [Pseudomonadota bacterium]
MNSITTRALTRIITTLLSLLIGAWLSHVLLQMVKVENWVRAEAQRCREIAPSLRLFSLMSYCFMTLKS